MKIYLILDLIIISVPLLMSFEQKMRYWKKWPYSFPAIIVVGVMFFFWDVLAVGHGDWGFDPRYLVGPKVAGIPAEEILFFAVVPYSCLFIYEAVNFFCKDRVWNIPAWIFCLGA